MRGIEAGSHHAETPGHDDGPPAWVPGKRYLRGGGKTLYLSGRIQNSVTPLRLMQKARMMGGEKCSLLEVPCM